MTKTQSKSGGKRKRVRRRVHRGRLALVCTVAALIIIVLMAVISRSCSDFGFIRGGGDFRKPVPEAIGRGQSDARRALGQPAGSMERQEVLLEIRAREQRLREAGYEHAADDYYNSAREVLRTAGALNN